MVFTNVNKFWKALRDFAIQEGFELVKVKNDKARVIALLEKQMCVAEKNGSTSLENDNMCYVSFRIREQECVSWCGEIQNQRSEVLGKTFNLH